MQGGDSASKIMEDYFPLLIYAADGMTLVDSLFIDK